ncbi:MAG: hypothetical protein QF475_00530, partial [Candidatus Undinarchaeales archaeon]|nr:hypothetical protein [Candidatus Undinarchaeales archaeon]
NGAVTTPHGFEDVAGTGITCSSVISAAEAKDSNRVKIAGDIKLFGIKQERSIRCYLTLPYNQGAGYSGYIVETSFEYVYSVHSKPLSIQVRALR